MINGIKAFAGYVKEGAECYRDDFNDWKNRDCPDLFLLPIFVGMAIGFAIVASLDQIEGTNLQSDGEIAGFATASVVSGTILPAVYFAIKGWCHKRETEGPMGSTY